MSVFMTNLYVFAQAQQAVVDDKLPELSYEWAFFKMLIIMLVVIALAFVVIKFLLPRLVSMRRNQNSNIKILDYQALEQRKSIFLLQIKNKEIAVAVTDHNVTKLAEWEE